MFKLLDCTLREAPLENLMWGDMSIRKVINGLEIAGVNVIEVGFLKNDNHNNGSTSFQKIEEIEPYIQRKENVTYVALVDYGRYDLKNLKNFDGKSIDAIRICFKHNEIGKVLEYAQEVRNKGYKVCIQHVDTMGYSDEEIISFINKVNIFKPYAYSIVDTFGAMYGTDVMHYLSLVTDILDKDIWLGLHAHNNLMLADANNQLFISKYWNKRKIIVDTSLYGCGRSAGNAHTELIAHFVNSKFEYKYNLDEILDLIDTVISAAQEKTSWGYSIPYFIAGIYNAHTFNVKQLLKRHNLKSKDLRGIINKLDNTQKKAYDYALLERLYVEYFDNPINDDDVIENLTEEWKERSILLLGPSVLVKAKHDDITDFIQKNSPIVIGVNNLIEGYILDYVFFSSSVRYENLQYLDYKTAGMPHILLTSNIKQNASEGESIVDYCSLIKFGWVNIDSSLILLLRLLVKCNIKDIYIAGIDGYKDFGNTFYRKELDSNLDEQTRADYTKDNYDMLLDLKKENPELIIHFLTESVYSEVFADD